MDSRSGYLRKFSEVSVLGDIYGHMELIDADNPCKEIVGLFD